MDNCSHSFSGKSLQSSALLMAHFPYVMEFSTSKTGELFTVQGFALVYSRPMHPLPDIVSSGSRITLCLEPVDKSIRPMDPLVSPLLAFQSYSIIMGGSIGFPVRGSPSISDLSWFIRQEGVGVDPDLPDGSLCPAPRHKLNLS